MAKQPTLLQNAAELRNKAERAIRLGIGLPAADQERLTQFAEELRERATELERQAAAETPSRPTEPERTDALNAQDSKKKRGGSNDPEPQS
jgi:hypothetical protein